MLFGIPNLELMDLVVFMSSNQVFICLWPSVGRLSEFYVQQLENPSVGSAISDPSVGSAIRILWRRVRNKHKIGRVSFF